MAVILVTDEERRTCGCGHLGMRRKHYNGDHADAFNTNRITRYGTSAAVKWESVATVSREPPIRGEPANLCEIPIFGLISPRWNTRRVDPMNAPPSHQPPVSE